MPEFRHYDSFQERTWGGNVKFKGLQRRKGSQMEHANLRMIPVEIGSANFGMNKTVLAVKTVSKSRCSRTGTYFKFGLKKFRIELIV